MKSQGLLLAIVGVWLLFQVVAGDLPGRLLSYGRTTNPLNANSRPDPTKPAGPGNWPKVDQNGNPDPNGAYSLQPGQGTGGYNLVPNF